MPRPKAKKPSNSQAAKLDPQRRNQTYVGWTLAGGAIILFGVPLLGGDVLGYFFILMLWSVVVIPLMVVILAILGARQVTLSRTGSRTKARGKATAVKTLRPWYEYVAIGVAAAMIFAFVCWLAVLLPQL